MRIAAPTDRLSIGIHTVSHRGTELKAELSGHGLRLADGALLKLFLRYPLYTVRVMVLTQWPQVMSLTSKAIIVCSSGLLMCRL